MNERAQSLGVTFELDGPVGRLTLDRPGRHNAVEAGDVRFIMQALDRVDGSPDVRVLLLTGSGERTFCAGASLDQMHSGEMSGEVFDSLTDRLSALRVPTICALNGNAYGGGAELALCCDLRIGVDDMVLSVPAARLGVCYPVGGLSRYVRRLGLGPASRILLAAEELEATELLRIGFLTRVVDRQDFRDQVEATARGIASLAPLAVQSMKRIMAGIADGSLDPDEARGLVARCATSADLEEGLAAWRERRPPNFQGR